jgi:hypothetical protein
VLTPALSLLALLIVGAVPAAAQIPPACLHGANEAPAQRVRRDAAIQLATRINLAQTMTIGPGPRSNRYRPLEELMNIPPTPAGFDLQFHTNGDTYSFSIKDRMDPCRYAVFSDQDKFLYEAIARRDEPVVVPLDTR